MSLILAKWSCIFSYAWKFYNSTMGTISRYMMKDNQNLISFKEDTILKIHNTTKSRVHYKHNIFWKLQNQLKTLISYITIIKKYYHLSTEIACSFCLLVILISVKEALISLYLCNNWKHDKEIRCAFKICHDKHN